MEGHQGGTKNVWRLCEAGSDRCGEPGCHTKGVCEPNLMILSIWIDKDD